MAFSILSLLNYQAFIWLSETCRCFTTRGIRGAWGTECEGLLLLILWVFPKMRGPQYRTPNTIILIMATPKMVPLTFLAQPARKFTHIRAMAAEALRVRVTDMNFPRIDAGRSRWSRPGLSVETILVRKGPRT